jgi:hypothetical protein
MRQWNNWDTPEEGELFPVLAKYFQEFTPHAYINNAIQTNPLLVRIPEMQPDPSYWNRYGISAMDKLIHEHYVIPLQMAGFTHWFGVGIYHPFDAAAITKIAEIASDSVAWNVLTPPEFSAMAAQFQLHMNQMLR